MYYELKQHEPKLKRLIEDQQTRLKEAQQKLIKVEGKQQLLDERIECAIKLHNVLENRIHRLKNLPGAHKKPLSKAEREFKSTLGNKFSLQYLTLFVWLTSLTNKVFDMAFGTMKSIFVVNYSYFFKAFKLFCLRD